MPKEYINPSTIHTPTGYTHVVKSGAMVFMAGQVGLDNNGQLVGKDDAEAQTRQALTNLEAAIRAAGGRKEDIMSMTIFLVNRDDIPGLRKGMTGFFDNPPANTLLIISGLARPELLVEIEARAVLE